MNTYNTLIKKIARNHLSESLDYAVKSNYGQFYTFKINYCEDKFIATDIEIYPYFDNYETYINGKFEDEEVSYSFTFLDSEKQTDILEAFVKTLDCKDEVSYEVCSHCEHFVITDKTLGIHVCPHCGRHFVSCCQCLGCGDETTLHCDKCCLHHLAETKNREQIEKIVNRIAEISVAHNYNEIPFYADGSLTKYYYDGNRITGINASEYDTEHLDVFTKNPSEGKEDLLYVCDLNYFDLNLLKHLLENAENINWKWVDKKLEPKMKQYSLNGAITVTLNDVKVEAHNETEAKDIARKMVEEALTLYGNVDTQVDDTERNIQLNIR